MKKEESRSRRTYFKSGEEGEKPQTEKRGTKKKGTNEKNHALGGWGEPQSKIMLKKGRKRKPGNTGIGKGGEKNRRPP